MLGEDREHAGSEMIKLHARDGISFELRIQKEVPRFEESAVQRWPRNWHILLNAHIIFPCDVQNSRPIPHPPIFGISQ
jgi:hypothetical protein